MQSGREAGKLMGEVLDGEGRVMITTLDAAAQWSLDRESGAREALEAFDGIEVVRTLNTGTDPQEIFASIPENAMLAPPRSLRIPRAFWSLECCSTPAAGEWVSRNGRTGRGQDRWLRSARPDRRSRIGGGDPGDDRPGARASGLLRRSTSWFGS